MGPNFTVASSRLQTFVGFGPWLKLKPVWTVCIKLNRRWFFEKAQTGHLSVQQDVPWCTNRDGTSLTWLYLRHMGWLCCRLNELTPLGLKLEGHSVWAHQTLSPSPTAFTLLTFLMVSVQQLFLEACFYWMKSLSLVWIPFECCPWLVQAALS